MRNDAFDFVGNNESVKVVLTRNEVIGENWFLDVTKDVMHNLGKDLHVNVAGDIFYTGGATYQMKINKDYERQDRRRPRRRRRRQDAAQVDGRHRRCNRRPASCR